MKKIKLTQNQFALVDGEDYEELSEYKWCAAWNNKTKSFYAVRYNNKDKRTVRMSREILGLKYGDKREIDHINHNTLNNCRYNLRIATSSQNSMNSKKRDRCSSQFKGVSWHKATRKWRAYIGRPQVHLGLFGNETKAANCYEEKARELFGEFAYNQTV